MRVSSITLYLVLLSLSGPAYGRSRAAQELDALFGAPSLPVQKAQPRRPANASMPASLNARANLLLSPRSNCGIGDSCSADRCCPEDFICTNDGTGCCGTGYKPCGTSGCYAPAVEICCGGASICQSNQICVGEDSCCDHPATQLCGSDNCLSPNFQICCQSGGNHHIVCDSDETCCNFECCFGDTCGSDGYCHGNGSVNSTRSGSSSYNSEAVQFGMSRAMLGGIVVAGMVVMLVS